MKKAVLFDLDGTLLDTLDDLADSMNSVLSRMGFPRHGREAYKIFVGDGMINLAKRALPPDRRESAMVQSAVVSMDREYAENWHRKTRPYDGVPELLSEIATRGIAMSVLSNKPHTFTETMVRYYFPHHAFAFVFGAREGIPRKPDPQAALEIAEGMGALPADVRYLGDTGTDMQTARRAGMLAVGALWGFREEAELKENGAALVIGQPGEFLSCL